MMNLRKSTFFLVNNPFLNLKSKSWDSAGFIIVTHDLPFYHHCSCFSNWILEMSCRNFRTFGPSSFLQSLFEVGILFRSCVLSVKQPWWMEHRDGEACMLWKSLHFSRSRMVDEAPRWLFCREEGVLETAAFIFLLNLYTVLTVYIARMPFM